MFLQPCWWGPQSPPPALHKKMLKGPSSSTADALAATTSLTRADCRGSLLGRGSKSFSRAGGYCSACAASTQSKRRWAAQAERVCSGLVCFDWNLLLNRDREAHATLSTLVCLFKLLSYELQSSFYLKCLLELCLKCRVDTWNAHHIYMLCCTDLVILINILIIYFPYTAFYILPLRWSWLLHFIHKNWLTCATLETHSILTPGIKAFIWCPDLVRCPRSSEVCLFLCVFLRPNGCECHAAIRQYGSTGLLLEGWEQFTL